jgi:hypothetical protein
VLRYVDGQKYEPHYDYFHDTVNTRIENGGQRIVTMLMYLSTPDEGGETVFPDADRKVGGWGGGGEGGGKGSAFDSHAAERVMLTRTFLWRLGGAVRVAGETVFLMLTARCALGGGCGGAFGTVPWRAV